MRVRHLLLSALFAAATAVTSFAADVTGTWTTEFDTQIGVQKYVFTFKADGEKLTGTADAERSGQKQAQVVLEGGSVKGETIAFTENLTFEGMTVPVTYKGTIAGDEIKFTREVGTFATETFVAKRKKD